ncbi:MAG: transglycosylase SLT domain-containing protein [Acidimicrobiia bacterium]|nr:transglycosylase SLT domain-containing protein [Acidimicrobiia bacterium]
MRPSRPSLLLVLLLLVLLALGSVTAASAETELEKARREAQETSRARDAADRRLQEDQAVADDFESRLQRTLDDYRATNGELERIGLTIAGLRHDMDVLRSDIRQLDADAQTRAVDAYMRRVGIDDSALMLSDSFGSMAMLDDSLDQISARDLAVFDELDTKRTELMLLQSQLGREQAQVEVLSARLDEQQLLLEVLFAEADAAVAEAFRTLEAVDEAYRVAQEQLAEAERKYRWTGSVSQWRALVETYFPPERVEEALRVMACESGGNPNAKNPHSTATGLFQFLDGTWAWSSVLAGYAGHSRLDPEANIAVAAWLVDYSIRSGHPYGAWGHWECQP